MNLLASLFTKSSVATASPVNRYNNTDDNANCKIVWNKDNETITITFDENTNFSLTNGTPFVLEKNPNNTDKDKTKHDFYRCKLDKITAGANSSIIIHYMFYEKNTEKLMNGRYSIQAQKKETLPIPPSETSSALPPQPPSDTPPSDTIYENKFVDDKDNTFIIREYVSGNELADPSKLVPTQPNADKKINGTINPLTFNEKLFLEKGWGVKGGKSKRRKNKKSGKKSRRKNRK